MRRGDIVTVVLSGDYGKPRPALIMQSDQFGQYPSVTVLPLTSDLHDLPLLRKQIPAAEATGLRVVSYVMIDKAATVPRGKIGGRIGQVDPQTLAMISRALRNFLDL